MTREQLLRTYLEDDVFTEKGYLEESEAQEFEWADKRQILIIEVLKTIIKGELSGEGEQTTTRKANKLISGKL
ncbi:MAG: hypothetical protein WD357_02040 [Gracilimonas sp.]